MLHLCIDAGAQKRARLIDPTQSLPLAGAHTSGCNAGVRTTVQFVFNRKPLPSLRDRRAHKCQLLQSHRFAIQICCCMRAGAQLYSAHEASSVAPARRQTDADADAVWGIQRVHSTKLMCRPRQWRCGSAGLLLLGICRLLTSACAQPLYRSHIDPQHHDASTSWPVQYQAHSRTLQQQPLCVTDAESDQTFTAALQQRSCDKIVVRVRGDIISSAAVVTAGAERVSVVAAHPGGAPPLLQVWPAC